MKLLNNMQQMGRTTSFVVLINQIFFNIITSHKDSPNEQVWEQQHFIILKQNTGSLGKQAEGPKLHSHSQHTDQHYVFTVKFSLLGFANLYVCVNS